MSMSKSQITTRLTVIVIILVNYEAYFMLISLG